MVPTSNINLHHQYLELLLLTSPVDKPRIREFSLCKEERERTLQRYFLSVLR
jgi:hypothetical protein